uniref:Uncharacterized protein n=1 Tax=viral metagenome TaxID=1070528 RepID=A0A6M3K0R1_9ZZZZ
MRRLMRYLKKRKERKQGIERLALAFAGECMLFHAENAAEYYDNGMRAEDVWKMGDRQCKYQ